MPKVIFESPDSPPLEASVPEGGSLADLCDLVDAPIPFSCRNANCGTCRVVILEGGDQLEPAEEDELNVLEIFASPSNHRLACCAGLKPGYAILRLRPVRDDE